MHKPQKLLSDELEQAAQEVTIGGLYCHYKNPHQSYRVLNLAITEWDDQVCVIYEAQYGDRILFVRPLHSWLEEVIWGDQTVPRFALVK